MALIYPSEKITRRWDGALRTRLRRAPLEHFLNAHGFTPLPPGSNQMSDNLVRATVFIMEKSLLEYCAPPGQPLHRHEHSAVGHTACLVSRAAATVIGEPNAWRVAALQSTSRLLRDHLSHTAAAVTAASVVRLHEEMREIGASSLATDISEAIAALLVTPTKAAYAAAFTLVAKSLHRESAVAHTQRLGAPKTLTGQ